MKHPLTSKERRGLLAVAAAALFCVSVGMVFRGCSGRGASGEGTAVVVIDNDSVAGQRSRGDSVSSKSKKRSSSKTSRKKKTVVYPTRSPLDEPCD